MNLLLITDLEGVNGVLNFDDWCVPEGRRNETGCRFLTEEVNAVVAGWFAGGADGVTVWDGHGSGGSIRGEMLDGRAALQRGCVDYPLLGGSFDGVGFVGQHAKAGTANAHLAHTQTEEAVDFRVNGVSLGEFGQLSYTFAELGVPVVFASGDLALTREAASLVPGIFAVPVKEGLTRPLDASCPADEVMARESAAVHYPRAAVLASLRETAEKSMRQLALSPSHFAIKPLAGPYRAEAEYRAIGTKLAPLFGNLSARSIYTGVHALFADVLREFYGTLEWRRSDGRKIRKI